MKIEKSNADFRHIIIYLWNSRVWMLIYSFTPICELVKLLGETDMYFHVFVLLVFVSVSFMTISKTNMKTVKGNLLYVCQSAS